MRLLMLQRLLRLTGKSQHTSIALHLLQDFCQWLSPITAGEAARGVPESHRAYFKRRKAASPDHAPV